LEKWESAEQEETYKEWMYSYNNEYSPGTDKTFRIEGQDDEEEDASDGEQDLDHEIDEEDVETGTHAFQQSKIKEAP
jgi:hypothetical protein